MKKILSAGLALGICLSLTACGESLEKPTEPTQPAPIWAVAPEERQTEPSAPLPVETVPPTQAPTLAEEPSQEATAATEETAAETTEPAEDKPRYNMEEKFEPASGTLFAKKKVNVRDQANTDSIVLTRLSQGEEVQVVGTSPDGWTAIVQGERVAYVSSEYLADDQPEPAPDPNKIEEKPLDDQVYTNHGVNMRDGPGIDHSVLVKIPENTELHRIAEANLEWFKVEYKDQVGWVNGAYIVPKYFDSEEHPAETVVEEQVHTTREVNLRKGPSTEKEILNRVPEGTELTRIATTSNEWSKVIYKDQEGYISSKYLETGSLPQTEG